MHQFTTNPPYGRNGARLLVAVAVLVVVTTGMALVGGSNDDTALDQDICLLNAHGDGHVTLLLDFQKPVRQSGYANLLRDITLELSAGNELRVFSLTLSAAVPRQFLGRLCKPYDPTALSIDTAKDKHGATRDCDDLRAQIAPVLREAASDFCRRRDWLQGRINAVGTHTQPAGPVANAHLIQALDDTLQELAQRPGRQRLYVLSDMVQHAASYSHLDLPWSAWGFENFAAVASGARSAPTQGSAQQPKRQRPLPAEKWSDGREADEAGAPSVLARILRRGRSDVQRAVPPAGVRGSATDADAEDGRIRGSGTQAAPIATPGGRGPAWAGRAGD